MTKKSKNTSKNEKKLPKKLKNKTEKIPHTKKRNNGNIK